MFGLWRSNSFQLLRIRWIIAGAVLRSIVCILEIRLLFAFVNLSMQNSEFPSIAARVIYFFSKFLAQDNDFPAF